MRISIAILDDNVAFLEEFAIQVQEQCRILGLDAQIYPFSQAQDLHHFLNTGEQIDAAFVDIILPGESGISFAAKFQREFPHIKLLFITAVMANAVDIFDARPSYFLVKPVTAERLRKALVTVVEELQKEENNSIVVFGKGYAHRLRNSDIIFIEIRGRQLEIHLQPNIVLSVYGKMADMEKRTEGALFRCHRSYLINLSYVDQIDKQDYILFTGQSIPISRERRGQARSLFFQYLALHERRNQTWI